MERDFMGLSSKETLLLLKKKKKEEEEDEMNNNNGGSKDSVCLGLMKGSEVKWPFLNKVSSHPHLMSFGVSQNDKAKMMASDSVTSAGFFAIPSLDAFHSVQKRTAGELQKSLNHDGQDGIHFSLTPYHVGQNMNGANVKQQLPVTAPHSVLPLIAGITESCAKPTVPSPQLTIFYAGTVNVFGDISPEKAQTIMLLAGNGISAASNMSQPKVQAPKFASSDGASVSQHINIPLCSGLPSPLSVSSRTGTQSRSGSSSNDEFLTVKTSGHPTNSVSKVETPEVVNATTMLTSAVPQARKASLARFLEKRKERVMNAAPYNLNNMSENVKMQNSIGTNALSAKQG